MANENRVLAYEKASEIKDSDLITISGGTAKQTLINDVRMTGYSPAPMDMEIGQIFD